jgi:hypothetical protein
MNVRGECTCGRKFLNAEDFRDHLPCEGTPQQREIARLKEEVARLTKKQAEMAAEIIQLQSEKIALQNELELVPR